MYELLEESFGIAGWTRVNGVPSLQIDQEIRSILLAVRPSC